MSPQNRARQGSVGQGSARQCGTVTAPSSTCACSCACHVSHLASPALQVSLETAEHINLPQKICHNQIKSNKGNKIRQDKMRGCRRRLCKKTKDNFVVNKIR